MFEHITLCHVYILDVECYVGSLLTTLHALKVSIKMIDCDLVVRLFRWVARKDLNFSMHPVGE